jgi:hypothetical protein
MTVRRVRRIVRKIDPWTVLKAAFVINLVIGLSATLGIWIAWSIAVQRGIPVDISETLARLTIAFTPDGDLYFRVVLMAAIIWVVGATALLTLLAVLYNLVSDIVGGVELVMLEEVVEQSSAAESRPRPVVHVPTNGSSSPMTTQDTVEHAN